MFNAVTSFLEPPIKISTLNKVIGTLTVANKIISLLFHKNTNTNKIKLINLMLYNIFLFSFAKNLTIMAKRSGKKDDKDSKSKGSKHPKEKAEHKKSGKSRVNASLLS